MSNSARWSRVSIWQLVQEAPPGGTIARWRRGSITVGTTRDGLDQRSAARRIERCSKQTANCAICDTT
jgi:hypothetical protein